ncbi:MAG: hypothetical protein IT373_07510 [Polyangiaceae bacterium]|nr:hypothetical protein [Polyangiaceae bacterium]
MFEHVPEDVLVAMGERLRGEALVLQARYSLDLAAGDGDELRALLPADFVPATAALAAAIGILLADPALAAADAGLSQAGADDGVRAAKVWRRRLVQRAVRAQRFGAKLPAELVQVGRAGAAGPLAVQLRSLAKLATDHAAELAKAGAEPAGLVSEGLALADVLARAVRDREVHSLSDLPAAARQLCADKGRLYFALKALHDAGHELYAHDPVGAARYNLTLLYRREG